MIVHSTTLDTMAKVIAIYGGTKWIQHSGYMLRAATNGVIANSAVKTGGNDNAIIPSHYHSVNAVGIASSGAHTHTLYYLNDNQIGGKSHRIGTASDCYGDNKASVKNNTGAHGHTVPAHNTNYSGQDATNANIPNYKSVYIWERTA